MVSICVYCGSSQGAGRAYDNAASSVGEEFVRRHISLIYGGGSMGLMGRVAETVQNGGGDVVGIIPVALEKISGQTPGRVIVTSDMHQRKATMASKADAFIALPGGFGTLEELFEIITWCQIGYLSKPVGLLNVDGFFDSLLLFLDNAVVAGFISQAARSILLVDSNPASLIDRITAAAVGSSPRGGNLK